MILYRKQFLEAFENMLPFMVEFNSDGSMKAKTYPSNCTVGGPDRRPIIFITHDESVFSANDGRHQAWISENGVFLRPKGKGKGIMVSDFLLPWSRLNLLSLSQEQQDNFVASGIPLEAVEYYEYGQEEGYWDGKKLLEQLKKRAIPIAEALYPGYQFLFVFDNATSHSVYANDALLVKDMNKGEGGDQPLLRSGWYSNGTIVVTQEMFFTKADPSTGIFTRVPKGIQRVLEERKLWPSKGLLLECPKKKCSKERCQNLLTCKTCVKGSRCESCKKKKVHSGTCTTKRICDNCHQRKERCRCVQKQTCAPCKTRLREGCKDCDELSGCTSDSQFSLSFYPAIHIY